MLIVTMFLLVLTGIEFNPSFSTLSVLTRLRNEYGLNRQQTDELIDLFRASRAAGNLDPFSRKVESLLTDHQLAMLRSHSFQCALGSGNLKRALQENHIELTNEQIDLIKLDTHATRTVAKSHYGDDRHSIGVWTLAPLIKASEIEALEGPKFEFTTLPGANGGYTSDYVDTIPLEAILWPEVYTELQLKVKQLDAARALRQRFVEMDVVVDEDWEPVTADDGNPGRASDELYDEVKAILDPKQATRFDQILLQRYVASFPPFAVRQLQRLGTSILDKNKEFSSRMYSYHIYVRSVRHYRNLHHFARRAEDYLGREQVRKLMVPTFVPKLSHKAPVLEAEIFLELTGAKEKQNQREIMERRRNGE